MTQEQILRRQIKLLSWLFVISLVLLSSSCSGADNSRHSERRFSVALPNRISVDVIEKFSSGWDGSVYSYEMWQSNRVIAYSAEWNRPMEIKTGQAGDATCFFQRTLLCIYHEGAWVVWHAEDESIQKWWKGFEKLDGKNWQSPWNLSGFGVESFSLEGSSWIVTLLTGTSDKEHDWSQGRVPPRIHVKSEDGGKGWRVLENFTLLKEQNPPKQPAVETNAGPAMK